MIPVGTHFLVFVPVKMNHILLGASKNDLIDTFISDTLTVLTSWFLHQDEPDLAWF